MNTTHRLTQTIMIAATLAAGFMVQAADASATVAQVVRLDTVHITGKRLSGTPTAVVQLPRVQITGKRDADGTTLLAQKNSRAAVAKAVAPV